MSRVWTQSDPEHVVSSECDGIFERPCELVIACCDTTEILEPADGGFDAPALLVAAFVVADGLGSVLPAWNDGTGAVGSQQLTKGIGVVGTIGDQTVERAGLVDKAWRDTDVSVVAWSEMKHDRPAK